MGQTWVKSSFGEVKICRRKNFFCSGDKKISKSLSSKTKIQNCRNPLYYSVFRQFCGRSGEIRTRGPMVPNHVRYQLRYTPINLFNFCGSLLPNQARYQLRYTPVLLYYIKCRVYFTIRRANVQYARCSGLAVIRCCTAYTPSCSS